MFFSRPTSELILILDVQSSIVRGTLVQIAEHAIPHVLCTHDVKIPYKAHARSGYLIKMALKAVNESVHETLKHLHTQSRTIRIPSRISAVHYVLSSPWIVSQAKTITRTFDKNTHVDRDYIMKLVEEERGHMLSKDKSDIRVIEEKVFDVRLNGYSIASWESRQTRELEVLFVTSVAGNRMTDRFIEACDHAVHRNKVFFHSSLFLQHIAIQRILPEYSSYSIIHIHGELTDVAVIQARSCTFFGSYPFGVHSIVRTIAREAKVDPQTAESALNMHAQGHLDGIHAKTEQLIIDNMSHGWIGEFRKLLKSGSTEITLPYSAIISAHSIEDFFMKTFASAYPAISLRRLTLDDVIAHVSYDQQADRQRLTCLYIISIHDLEK